MATWSPISGTLPQYDRTAAAGGGPASGYFLKFYDTSIVAISMASDKDGGGSLDKAQLDSSGYPINGSSARFIPYIDRDYKIALYTNAVDADADTTGNADWFPVTTLVMASRNELTFAKIFDTKALMVASTLFTTGDIGNTVEMLGYFSNDDGKGNHFEIVGSGTSTDDGGSFLDSTGSPTIQFKALFPGGKINVGQFGVVGTGLTGDVPRIQAAIDYRYANQLNTETLHSITIIIPQPAYGSAIPELWFNNIKCLLDAQIKVPENMALRGDNAILVIGINDAISIAEQTNEISGFYILSEESTPTYRAIDINFDRSFKAVDVPRFKIEKCFFKNLADCIVHNANVVNGFSMMSIVECHFINILQMSSRLRSDGGVIERCSIYGQFSTADIPTINNEGGHLAVNDCVFVPWPYVSSTTSITNARWFDNQVGFIKITKSRFGNEDINAGINPVADYRDALNVTIVYSHAEHGSNNTAGGVFYENANINGVVLRDNIMFHRNSTAVKLFKLPTQIIIKGNRGVAGSTFDATLDVIKKDYLISLDSSYVAPGQGSRRTLCQIDIDTPSNFMHLVDTGSDFSNELWESIRMDEYSTRYFVADSVTGSTAQFTIDVGRLPAAHYAVIKFYGKPRAGTAAVAMGRIEYKSRVFWDTTTVEEKKQVIIIATDFTRADEGGSPVHLVPAIAQLQWGSAGSTSTVITRDDLRLQVTNTGIAGDILSVYAVLESNPVQQGMHT